MSEVMIPIVISVAMFAMIAFIVAVGGRTRARRIEAVTSLQTRMLDKFGSAQEFVTFLQSPQGREFLGKTTDSQLAPMERILKSIRTGIILTLLGLAFLVLSLSVNHDMVVPGTLVLAIGLGFLVSAGISVRLSRSWGLTSSSATGLLTEQ